jgi:hypothetical protein
MTIASHFEHHLGPVQQGWKRTPPTASGIRALLFKNQPVQGVDTLGTLGLSDEALPFSDGKHVRQELVILDVPKISEGSARLLSQQDREGSSVLGGAMMPANQAMLDLLVGLVAESARPLASGLAELLEEALVDENGCWFLASLRKALEQRH